MTEITYSFKSIVLNDQRFGMLIGTMYSARSVNERIAFNRYILEYSFTQHNNVKNNDLKLSWFTHTFVNNTFESLLYYYKI